MSDAGVKLLHAVPGRIRVRIPRIKNDPEYAARIGERLRALPGITAVAASPVTASVVVRYDDATTSFPELIPGLSETFRTHLFPEIDRERIESMLRASPNGSAAASTLTHRVYSFFGAVDQGVGQATAGNLDLRILLPATLFVLGVVRLLSQSNVPTPTWFDLIWFSFGTFMALNVPAATAAPP
jgi:hypothetical protein